MSRFNHGNNVYVTTMEDALIIRSEQSADAHAIRHIVKEAFAKAEHTDSDEHNLVERLRSTDDYIAELSLVAEINGKAVGYIMFSRIYIGPTEAVALAPLAVLPGFQNRKIGQALIQAGHHRARALGYSCSVVLGAPGYYARYHYLPASQFGITPPFDVPAEFYMVCQLNPPIPRGEVCYSPAFRL